MSRHSEPDRHAGLRSARDDYSWLVVPFVLAATLGLAAASWVITLQQMNGMDMGAATELGSFASFVGFWVVMMAAMMLPAAVPAVLTRAQTSGQARAVPRFLGSYLLVWTLVGAVVYRGVPAARVTRRRHARDCGRHLRAQPAQAGLPPTLPGQSPLRIRFGLYCVGSSIGLMLMLVALGAHERHLDAAGRPARPGPEAPAAKPAIDVPLALAIVALGTVILVAPSSVPGLMPPM